MSGVKVELNRLKKRVRRGAGRWPTHKQREAFRAALFNRLARQKAGEDVSDYVMPEYPLPDSLCIGARERLAQRVMDIADRMEKAAQREKARKSEQVEERGAVASFVADKMQELD